MTNMPHVLFPISALGGCNCYLKAPTIPTCRSPETHLDDCPAKNSGYQVGLFAASAPSETPPRVCPLHGPMAQIDAPRYITSGELITRVSEIPPGVYHTEHDTKWWTCFQCAASAPAEPATKFEPSVPERRQDLPVSAPAPETTTPTHELKVWPEYGDALESGAKTFEFRKDDRSPRFEVGDILLLNEWGESGYTGRNWLRRVTYVARGEVIPEGYCVMSIVPQWSNDYPCPYGCNDNAPRSPATQTPAPTDKCGNCTHERHEHIAGLGCTHVHQPSGGYQGQMVRGCRRCEEFVEPVSPVASPATEPSTEPHDALIADLLAETSRLRAENERQREVIRDYLMMPESKELLRRLRSLTQTPEATP